MRKFLATTLALLSAQLDARDAVLGAGIALLAIGLYQVFVPAAFIVPGAVLTYVAVFGQPRMASGE